MAKNIEKTKSKLKKTTTAAGIVNTLEWLIIAFVLAFTFRAFITEAFRIPTGSMAPTLRGNHSQSVCVQCGYSFDSNRGDRDNPQTLPRVKCPSCGAIQYPQRTLSNGDRILVYKCGYHFKDPKRWDVFVFKYPNDPRTNYIKRLVGLPGEEITIIDGDIYVNGEVTRKPKKVQDELWMPIYNSDYVPAKPNLRIFNGHSWQLPFVNEDNSTWTLNSDNGSIALKSIPTELNTVFYDSSLGNDLKSSYTYNTLGHMPYAFYCSDLSLRFVIENKQNTGVVGALLSKHGVDYTATVDFNGKIKIAKIIDGNETVLLDKEISPVSPDKQIPFSFENVDHELKLEVGTYKFSVDLGRKLSDVGLSVTESQVKIFGGGEIELNHIELYRDIHYYNGFHGAQDNPMQLGDDEFFACGDNSANSLDSRLWDKEGKGNNGTHYPAGVVPRDYLVGKAFFIYWPSGMKPSETKFKSKVIPNIGEMKLIHGGKD